MIPISPDLPPEIPVSARMHPERLADELYDPERAQALKAGHWRNLSMMGPIPINVATKAVLAANSRFITLGKILCIVPTRRTVKRDTPSSDDGYLESHLTVFLLFLQEVHIQ